MTWIAVILGIALIVALFGLGNIRKLWLSAKAQATELSDQAVKADATAVLRETIEADACQIDQDERTIADYQGRLSGVTRQIDELTNKIEDHKATREVAADELAELIRAGKQNSPEFRELEAEFARLEAAIEGDNELLAQLRSQHETDRRFLADVIKRQDAARSRVKSKRAEADRLGYQLKLSEAAARMAEDRSRMAGIGASGSQSEAAREEVLRQIDAAKARAERGQQTMAADDLKTRLHEKAQARRSSTALAEALAKRGVSTNPTPAPAAASAPGLSDDDDPPITGC